ncbi:hypothetical protein Pmani_020334 [Petrolisthes manimaculis]|uniref:MADF domain-containing protein n=1 Tax=Petrolisthes manimaculis TaxID=1843537 RepID=A0AAE1PIY8_9EUCA|nr:hypothetical protein Pmani_020334 [Petrolisthes manimaculis]
MDKSSLRWTRESELLVIEKVRGNECLWDHRDTMFLKKTFKRQLYQQIALSIQKQFPALKGLTADAVMHKWGNLKKSFVRELHKTKQPKSGSVYRSKWHLFEALLFLTNTISADGSVCNYSKQQTQDNSPASMVECLVQNEVVDGTDNVDETLGHILDSSSEVYSPLSEAASSYPRSTSSGTQESDSSRDSHSYPRSR